MADSVSTTVSSLLEKYQIKDEDINTQVTDLHVDEIARSHCKKWKSLPAHLQMEAIAAKDIDLKQIEEEQKRCDFLSKWKEEKGSEATYKVLIGALLKIKSREDAEGICKIILSTTAGSTECSAPYMQAWGRTREREEGREGNQWRIQGLERGVSCACAQ